MYKKQRIQQTAERHVFILFHELNIRLQRASSTQDLPRCAGRSEELRVGESHLLKVCNRVRSVKWSERDSVDLLVLGGAILHVVEAQEMEGSLETFVRRPRDFASTKANKENKAAL